MKTTDKGIDYGMDKTNVDAETRIRYGVIPQNAVLQAWADSSEAYYPCEDCEIERDEDGNPDDMICACCEPAGFYVDDSEYLAESDSCGDIFITRSPYYTRAQFCSPCAPGACYLLNPCEDGERAYCFGHDWFEDGHAPYPVYRVVDDAEVLPE